MEMKGIERIIHSVEDKPYQILGPHVEKQGVVIRCFFPGKDIVMLKTLKDNQNHRMEMIQEAGLFEILLPLKEIPDYVFVVQEEGSYKEYRDPYGFPIPISYEDKVQFRHGIHYKIYEKLGAHPMRVRNINGTHFAVWAPNAQRVSVVGDFNHWDGRMYPMHKHHDAGIFEIFLPKVKPGSLYKFEIKLPDGLTYLKSDPYANGAELRPDTASVVTNLKRYQWNDRKWMKERQRYRKKDQPVCIYEVHLSSFCKPDDGKEFYNYKEIAPRLAEYVKQMGYTHVQIMPIMEYPLDQSWGYQVTGMYAPTSRYGTPQDFMSLIDILHQAGIGVILDWVPDQFARDAFAMGAFDGTSLYEISEGESDIYHYDYRKAQVKNYLIANAMFWADKYHIDGVKISGLSSMLYLHAGNNIYGGKENLDAIEFIKHLNSMMKKKYPDVCMIAGETSGWPQVTETVQGGGLGFDYAINDGWKNGILDYLQSDASNRIRRHNDLTLSMVYAFSESYLLGFSHDDYSMGKGLVLRNTAKEKLALLRAVYAYMFSHPGKKQLFMGQDLAADREWDETMPIQWELLEQDSHKAFQFFMRKLITVYRDHTAFYECDEHSDGFEWINAMEAQKSLLSFVRKAKDKKKHLLVVCNFSESPYEGYAVGVPFAGKYKEILNTDAKLFGGSGMVNARIKKSKAVECDGREHSIAIDLAPMSVSVFESRKG